VTFGPGVRLRSRDEFTAVQRHGRRVATRYLILLACPNTLGRDRLGIIASRRLGGAVVRNRAKRRIREMFRHRSTASTERGFDLVAIPKLDMTSAPFAAVESAFCSALDRLRSSRTT